MELSLRFRRGELDAAAYLEQSGAMDDYLAKRGVDIETLRTVADQTVQADWASSTESWLATHPSWEGGFEAVQRMGETLISLGLQDQPSVESLEAAYQELVRTNRVPANATLRAAQEQYDKISTATSVEQIREAVGGSSSLFGR